MKSWETIATIEKQENGKFKLIIYRNEKPIFAKEYNSFRSATIAQTKRLKSLRMI